MAVEPGFGGQPFDDSVLAKVRRPRRAGSDGRFRAIGLDGGISLGHHRGRADRSRRRLLRRGQFAGDPAAAMRTLREAAPRRLPDQLSSRITHYALLSRMTFDVSIMHELLMDELQIANC